MSPHLIHVMYGWLQICNSWSFLTLLYSFSLLLTLAACIMMTVKAYHWKGALGHEYYNTYCSVYIIMVTATLCETLYLENKWLGVTIQWVLLVVWEWVNCQEYNKQFLYTNTSPNFSFPWSPNESEMKYSLLGKMSASRYFPKSNHMFPELWHKHT